MFDYMVNDFEEWVLMFAKEYSYPKHVNLLKKVDGNYCTAWVDNSFVGWKAAIDAVNKEIQR